ncbi:helix-turn-helix domain-containing protein [Dankookia rubra]|nr:AraC family transcriptional regulator [Dankookia rubra]
MSLFPDGLVVTGEFGDFDALASATAGFDLTYSQIGGGAFFGTMDIVATRSMQIARERWSAPLLVEGNLPPGAVSVALVLSAPGEVRWLGRELDHGRTIIGGMLNHEVSFLSLGPMEIVAVSFEQDLFERHLAALLGTGMGGLGRDLEMRAAPATADCPTRGRAVSGLLGVLASGGAATPAARHHLQEAVLRIVLDGITMGESPAQIPLTVRRRAARAAEEVLRGRLDDPPSLAELCQITGASERTLHAAFQDCYGLPPKRYLRVLRLNAARRTPQAAP